jgi:hypothetical protein
MTPEEAKPHIKAAIEWALSRNIFLSTGRWGLLLKDNIWISSLINCMCPMAMVILHAQAEQKIPVHKSIDDYIDACNVSHLASKAAADVLGVEISDIERFTNGFDEAREGVHPWYALGQYFRTEYWDKLAKLRGRVHD